MTKLEDIIVSCAMESVRIFVILEYLKTFLEIHSVKRNAVNAVITYIVTLSSYLLFHNVLINMSITIIGIIFLSIGFSGNIRKKILLSVMVYAIMFVIDLLASFLLYKAPDSNNYEIISSFISVILFYIVVIAIKKFFDVKGRVDLSGQWYLLLFSALLSIAALYIVYKDMAVSRPAVITISIIVLFYNIILYIFYMSMLDRFLYERENLVLKQQMEIYEQQIKNNIDNNRKIQTIRHDMKHHIREIYDLIIKNKINDAKEYLYQINSEIINAQNKYNTGNDAFDGILNFYDEKYNNKSLQLVVSILIPDNLKINLSDTNIVLGNLLDNALENATYNTDVCLDIKYNSGILYLSMYNLYDGKIEKIDNHIVSRKGMNHGYGLNNIKKIVDKYSGLMIIETENRKFQVEIIMYIS